MRCPVKPVRFPNGRATWGGRQGGAEFYVNSIPQFDRPQQTSILAVSDLS